MGSCISKCYTNKHLDEENSNANNVQDKLVISQAPISPIPKPKKPQSPSQSPISTSSFSLATSVTSGSTFLSSSSSSLSCTSSTISSKERSFSNDFIRSCVKEHPHIIGIDQKPVPNKVYAQQLYSHATKPVCASPKQSTPKKRARANSPTLTRQKSFRKDVTPERAIGTYTNVPSRMARSPSPNRRFNSDKHDYKGALVHKPKVYKENMSRNYYGGKENFRAASPNNKFSRNGASLRDREMNKEIGTIGDEMEVQEEMSLSTEDISSILVEDINNPLIALDCFIFL